MREVINFIICEDELVLQKQYKKKIDCFMMKYDIDYECILFTEYNKNFQNIAKKDINI